MIIRVNPTPWHSHEALFGGHTVKLVGVKEVGLVETQAENIDSHG